MKWIKKQRSNERGIHKKTCFTINFISMKNIKTFITSFCQVGLVAVNTILIQKGYVLGIFIASFTISMLWSFNVAKIALSDFKSKLIYSLGAGLGALFGYFLVHSFMD